MENTTKLKAEKLKKLMGPGWTGKLMEQTGLKRQTVHQMVSSFNITHKHWPIVIALAKQNKERELETNELLTA